MCNIRKLELEAQPVLKSRVLLHEVSRASDILSATPNIHALIFYALTDFLWGEGWEQEWLSLDYTMVLTMAFTAMK